MRRSRYRGNSGVRIFAVVPRVTAVVGGAVHLPCNLSVPASNHDRDNVTLVLWSRSDVHGPLYSVDARNAPLERAKHFPSPDLGGRYDFNTSGQPTALLHIEPVRPEDAGEFRCRVDFRWARTHTFAVGLDVIGELLLDSASYARIHARFELSAGPCIEPACDIGVVKVCGH
ncbi:hypothetical protein HPB48_009966 [Haemaphysalis longicornis]|uniref:Ig-like domain-containing protein n=1 Tax=Haemaphysalis longicornis TaxID=44386 RepID=A0A9J6FXP9_HAELO|nr:hypothetical protein HPB48_009966 [Haemaphysalis longicornis]